MNDYAMLETACRSFLFNCDHPSRREETERAIWRIIVEAMKMMYDNPICGPVVINQRLSEMDLAQVRELKRQLNRILYDAVVREQEITGPPPLGLSVKEVIDTNEKMG